jgi:Cu/Zn superoxide dismutase
MEIFIKNENGLLQQTSIMSLLGIAFKKAKFKIDAATFRGENHNWIGVVQESKKPSEVVVNITFEDDGNTILGVHVYETPIKTVVDSDNSKQII